MDKKTTALVGAVLVALPALMTAATKWIEADAQARKAQVTKEELQKVLDNYSAYIVEEMEKRKQCP